MVTGILNAIFVYAIAYHMQLGLDRLMARVWSRGRARDGAVLDVEAAQARVNTTRSPNGAVFPCASGDEAESDGAKVDGGDQVSDQSCLDRFRKHISDVSTLCTLSGYASDFNGPNMAYVEEGRGVVGEQPEDALRALDGTGSAAAEGSSSLPFMRQAMRAVGLWMQQNIFLMSSILLFLFVGLPLASLRNNDLFLDVGFLSTVWLTFTSTQTRVKKHIMQPHPQRQNTHRGHHQVPRKPFLAALATLLNPVLWTSLFLLCYGLAKSHIRQEPTSAVVARFKTNNTISDLIAQHIHTSYLARAPRIPPPLPLGAGDIATSILNAGIVSWGLKLFEYRAQVVSRGGLAVLLTSALAAAANVLAWPLLARRAGVQPAAADLSFAARSVTIALGGPALASLGGDAGINAVGVVVNGICFQLAAGCFVGAEGGLEGVVGRCRRAAGGWLRVQLRRVRLSDGGGDGAEEGLPGAGCENALPSPAAAERGGGGAASRDHRCRHALRYSSDATRADERHLQTPSPCPCPCTCAGAVAADEEENSPGNGEGDHRHRDHRQEAGGDEDEAAAVVAGVTIGINAAAMGTVHLYEQNSRAAPYSALAMTMLGVFTVLFTVQSPMVEWLKGMVGV